MYCLPMLVSIVSKTFGRFDALDRLVSGMRRLHPHMHILTADDSMHNRLPAAAIERTDANFRFLRLPFDVGLSAGR